MQLLAKSFLSRFVTRIDLILISSTDVADCNPNFERITKKIQDYLRSDHLATVTQSVWKNNFSSQSLDATCSYSFW